MVKEREVRALQAEGTACAEALRQSGAQGRMPEASGSVLRSEKGEGTQCESPGAGLSPPGLPYMPLGWSTGPSKSCCAFHNPACTGAWPPTWPRSTEGHLQSLPAPSLAGGRLSGMHRFPLAQQPAVFPLGKDGCWWVCPVIPPVLWRASQVWVSTGQSRVIPHSHPQLDNP